MQDRHSTRKRNQTTFFTPSDNTPHKKPKIALDEKTDIKPIEEKKKGYDLPNQHILLGTVNVKEAFSRLFPDLQYAQGTPASAYKDGYSPLVFSKGKLAIAPNFFLQQHLNNGLIYGLYLLDDIEKDERIIAEYTGESRTINYEDDAEQKNGNNGSYELSTMLNDEKILIVDAKNKGNASRFANHSEHPDFYFDYEKKDESFFIKSNRKITLLRDENGKKIPLQVTVSYGSSFPFEQRIASQAHHTWLSPQEEFEIRKKDYVSLETLESKELKSTIRTLLNNPLSHKKIFIPKAIQFLENKDFKNVVHKSNVTHMIYVGEEKNNSLVIDSIQIELNALMIACYLNKKEKISYLVKQLSLSSQLGAHTTHEYKTALHFALDSTEAKTEEDKIALFQLLTQNNLPLILSVQDKDGMTVYHHCIKRNLYQCLEALCQITLQPEIYFDLPRHATPLITYAIEQGNMQAAALLMFTALKKIYIQHKHYKNREIIAAMQEWEENIQEQLIDLFDYPSWKKNLIETLTQNPPHTDESDFYNIFCALPELEPMQNSSLGRHSL